MIEGAQWILLLDDDASFRHLVSEILVNLGHSVYESSTAVEASQGLLARRPALAIVDYRLPDLDGVSWIKQVRENGFDFPIIFITSYFLDPITFNTLHHVLGVPLILQKPIVPAEFIEQIGQLLPTLANSAPDQAAVSGALSSSDLEAIGGGRINLMLRPEVKHPKAVEAALQAARREYARELPAVCSELTHSVRAAKEDRSDKASYQRAVHQAHKLRGSAGSYGFQAISNAGAKAESLLRNLEAEDSTLQEIVWSEIFRVLSDAEKTAAQVAAEALSAGGDGALPKKLLPRHIIIVAAPNQWQSLAGSLAKGGIADTTIAESCEQAIAVASERRPDVIFIDLGALSKLDAFMMVKQVRLLPDCDTVPFAVITEPQIVPSPAEAIYIGASVLLQKPIAELALKAVAQNLLSLREAFMPRVLTIDDDEVLCNFVKSILQAEGMVVEGLVEAIKVREVLDRFQPDVVLLDVMMPSISGYDVCRLIKGDERWSNTRVLFLTSKSGREGRALAFSAGGDDFLPKPVVSAELIGRVRAQLAQSPSVAERLERDTLTGCMQRRPFERAATALTENAEAKHGAISLALIEVNQFRELSAYYGLPMAERLLSELGSLVQARFRAEDVRARLGDFIVVLLPGQSAETTTATLRILESEFSQIVFAAPDGKTFICALNFGVAELWRDCHDAVGLIKVASMALLSKKQSG